MLNTIVCHINDKLNLLGYFSKNYGLVTRIKEGDKEYPAIENGNDFLEVSAFDKEIGTSYLRKRNEVQISKSDVQVMPNELFLNIQYPLYLIVCVKKKKPFEKLQSDTIAIDIIKSIVKDSDNELKTSLQAFRVDVMINDYNTISEEVYRQEYSGIDNIQLNYEYNYISLSVDVLVTARQSCLIKSC
jgi:hypothetical protein